MSKKTQNIVILGATGSVGQSTLRIVDSFPDRFNVVGLSAHTSVDAIRRDIERYRPDRVAISDEASAATLADCGAEVLPGSAGLTELVTAPDVDFVLCAIVGAAGLEPVLAAVEAGKIVAIANKEPLVMAGDLIMAAADKSGARVLPVDSEHSAVYQCIHGQPDSAVAKILLTCSGGPFRTWDGPLTDVTVADALNHPTWNMGPKITIDSATLMNKGLEVIEATRLFKIGADRVEVVIHPQSIVHSMVEFVDGSLLAQLGPTDMRGPIQYAMTYPERWHSAHTRFSLTDIARLDFAEPDRKRFPCLDLCYAAAAEGGTMPTVLNAANEVAVEAFLARRIPFPAIPALIEAVMNRHSARPADEINVILSTDAWARREAAEIERTLDGAAVSS